MNYCTMFIVCVAIFVLVGCESNYRDVTENDRTNMIVSLPVFSLDQPDASTLKIGIWCPDTLRSFTFHPLNRGGYEVTLSIEPTKYRRYASKDKDILRALIPEISEIDFWHYSPTISIDLDSRLVPK